MLAKILGIATISIAILMLAFPILSEIYYTIKFALEKEDDYSNPGMSARDAWRKHHGGID